MEDRETTGIRIQDRTHRLTGIGFQVWMTLARLNVEAAKRGQPRGASLQQLANRLEADKRVVSWQSAYDTARWYVWKFKKLNIVREADTDAERNAA